MVNNSLFIIGGGTATWDTGNASDALRALYALHLPVPIMFDG
eukprot:SAG22_NODE_11356_length_489_cov_0.661538_1_plen_41_part_10